MNPQNETEIEITFKPHMPGKWKYHLPIFINQDRESKKAELVLTGEGDNPKLLFDRRQIIMPVVPLGIESSCFFRIINDGYKSVSVKAFLPEDDELIPIKLDFVQGQRLG